MSIHCLGVAKCLTTDAPALKRKVAERWGDSDNVFSAFKICVAKMIIMA